MRDHSRGGGAVVAAAVAVIEQQSLNGGRPFPNTSASGKTRHSLSRSKQVCSSPKGNQSRRKTVSLTNNEVEESLRGREGSKKPSESISPYAFVNAKEKAEGTKSDADEEVQSLLNFTGMGVRRNETRKSHSPTNLHAASKNTSCLEELAPGGNSQFTVGNPLDYIDKIVSDRGDLGLNRVGSTSLRGNIFANTPKNWDVDVVKVNQSNHKIESADHNFEAAVNDFNLTAEDVQNFVSKYNSLKRKNNSSTTEGHKEAIVLRNQYIQGEKLEKLSTGSGYSAGSSDDFGTDSSEIDTSSNTDSDSGREHVINEGLETITEEDRATASSVHSTPGILNIPRSLSTCSRVLFIFSFERIR
ncbi:hypothetical protein ILUMI_27148 [Ignelater luminosus]|uniref:Uncharacterized protein n=1 Tax=Ignelater luminosus TaxID=2038154 RepID=A0A8K0C3T2_IGNLU|nr:hypothetical protein ILUMI_27148 [Ignelater luminosus]